MLLCHQVLESRRPATDKKKEKCRFRPPEGLPRKIGKNSLKIGKWPQNPSLEPSCPRFGLPPLFSGEAETHIFQFFPISARRLETYSVAGQQDRKSSSELTKTLMAPIHVTLEPPTPKCHRYNPPPKNVLDELVGPLKGTLTSLERSLPCTLGHTPRGSYSPTGRYRHLLATPPSKNHF